MSKNILRYIKILTSILIINMIICLIIWIIRNDTSLESLSNILFYSSGVFAVVTYLSSKGNLNLGISDRYYSYIASVKKNKEDSIKNYMELQDKAMNFSIILGLVTAINIAISLLILKF